MRCGTRWRLGVEPGERAQVERERDGPDDPVTATPEISQRYGFTDEPRDVRQRTRDRRHRLHSITKKGTGRCFTVLFTTHMAVARNMYVTHPHVPGVQTAVPAARGSIAEASVGGAENRLGRATPRRATRSGLG